MEPVQPGARARGELVLRGIPVSPGIGFGPLFAFAESFPLDAPAYCLLPAAIPHELDRLAAALKAARAQLADVRAAAATRAGEHDARIFLVHLQVLEDPQLQSQIEREIRTEQINAEAAVSSAIRRLSEMFEKLEDPLARERAADIRDVGRRILSHLAPETAVQGAPDAAHILVTNELLPSDAAHLDPDKLAAIITETGGPASHSAILARALAIPAVSGIRDLDRLAARGGQLAIVDGREGVVVVDPAPHTIEKYRGLRLVLEQIRAALHSEPALPAVTTDGTAIDILMNVESAGDVTADDLEQLQDLTGIGLYRTEFIYMERQSFPSEDEQFAVYKSVLEKAKGREVTFRTIDVGGDKPLPYFRVTDEDNPALGWRGFRISDEWPDLFIAQIRALLRASAHGNARIILPMITTVEEVRRAAAIVQDVKDDLVRRRGLPVAEKVPLGVMIEVPAAALAIESILREVDFASIGSNDLIQYLLAVDRNNARVAGLYQEMHPAVLSTIETVIRAGRRAHKPVSLCGEMAGNFYCTMVLLGLGLRRFSMAKQYVHGVGRLVRAVTLQEAEETARRVLSFAATGEVQAFLRARTREVFRSVGVVLTGE